MNLTISAEDFLTQLHQGEIKAQDINELTLTSCTDVQLAEILTELESQHLIDKIYILNLSYNALSSLPLEIGQLIALQQLDLSHNQLSSLPATMAQLTSLHLLNLQINQLSVLPSTMSQLTALQSLFLGHNRLKELPTAIGLLTALQKLFLENNLLCEIPPNIGQLTVLKQLVLYRNELTKLPAEIGNLTALETLAVYYNQLLTLPGTICQLTGLWALSLIGNKICDLPARIGNLTKLKYLQIGGNKLRTLPPTIGQLTKLQSLSIHGYHFLMLPESTAFMALIIKNKPEALDDASTLILDHAPIRALTVEAPLRSQLFTPSSLIQAEYNKKQLIRGLHLMMTLCQVNRHCEQGSVFTYHLIADMIKYLLSAEFNDKLGYRPFIPGFIEKFVSLFFTQSNPQGIQRGTPTTLRPNLSYTFDDLLNDKDAAIPLVNTTDALP